ncbi:MAG: putative ATP-dependent RNA helicase DDX1, partial [Streblomastix strix]
FFSVRILGGGLARVGWSTSTGSLDIGTDRQSIGYGGTGRYSHNQQFDPYGEAFFAGDEINCYLDLSTNEGKTSGGVVHFSKNGKLFPQLALPGSLSGEYLFPSFTMKGSYLQFDFTTKDTSHKKFS